MIDEYLNFRPGRQVVFDLPSGVSLFNRTKENNIPSTPPPNKPWTTVSVFTLKYIFLFYQNHNMLNNTL